MLDLAWVMFEQQTNVASLIHTIMLHTQSLLMCERCQVMLVDETGKVCVCVCVCVILLSSFSLQLLTVHYDTEANTDGTWDIPKKIVKNTPTTRLIRLRVRSK